MINNYEIVYIVKENVEDLTYVQKKVEDLLKGKVKKHDLWVSKEFAYPIKKEERGHYVLLNIETDGKNIFEFNSKVKFIKEIIRSLVINLDSEKTFKVRKRKEYVPRIRRENKDFSKKTKILKTPFIKSEIKKE